MTTREAHDPSWLGFVLTIVGDATQGEIADRTGLTQATVSRWLSGKRAPHAESVILFARGYRVNPVTALVAAGLLTAAEAEMPRNRVPSLDQVTTRSLLAELRRRDNAAGQAAS